MTSALRGAFVFISIWTAVAKRVAQTPLWLFRGDDVVRAQQVGRPTVTNSQSGALGAAAVQMGFFL